MKKIWIAVIFILAIALCGCSEPERLTANNEEMDKKLNQKLENDKPKEEEKDGKIHLTKGITEADVPFIENAAGLYVDCIISEDANRYANSFPNGHINAIMKEGGCDRMGAVDIAAKKIWEIVETNKKKYAKMKEAAAENGYTVVIKAVKRFDLESDLIREYKKNDIVVTDVVDINYDVKSGDEVVPGELRLVRL